MARRGLTTTQRGYGWEHQQARADALKHMPDGQPCPFCHQPMSKTMRLDYDHYPPLALGGTTLQRRLSHRSCNRRAGQAIAQHLRRGEPGTGWRHKPLSSRGDYQLRRSAVEAKATGT